MDFKMIQIRFNDFLNRENNIYQQLAKERERNELLQNELMKYENGGGVNSDSGPSPLASIDRREDSRFDSQFKSPDENRFIPSTAAEFKAYNDNLTIEQLSPVPAFKRDSKLDNNSYQITSNSNMTSLQQHF